MHLMALADTVATCKLNLCDRFAIDAAKAAMSRENPAATGGGGEPTPGTKFLDYTSRICYICMMIIAQSYQTFRRLFRWQAKIAPVVIWFICPFCRIVGRLWSSVFVGHETLHLLATLPSSLTAGTAAATRTRIIKHYLVKHIRSIRFFFYQK
jgi:hypothetical protein